MSEAVSSDTMPEPLPPRTKEPVRPETGHALRPRPPIAPDACDVDPATGHCATCADEAIEGRVLSLGPDALAEVEMRGRSREVAFDLVAGVRVGDRVLVHAGVAIARIEDREGS